MRLPLYFLLSVIISSCNPTYRYFQPTPNAAMFEKKYEVHVAGDIGSSGASAKASASITDFLSANVMYNRGMNQEENYLSDEWELGLGYYKAADVLRFHVFGGMGFGSTMSDSEVAPGLKAYEGDFVRPFIQANMGITSGRIINDAIVGDIVFVFKGNVMLYDGHRNAWNGSGYEQRKISSEYFYLEPAIMMNIGARGFRLEYVLGMAFRPAFEPLENASDARLSPLYTSIGLRIIIGRPRPE